MNTDSILSAILFANAAVFASFAAIVIVIAILAINNLIYEYWKPIKIINFYYSPYEVKELENERTQQSSGPQEDRTSHAGDKQQSNKN
jgi:hypothetical protein